MTFKTSTCLGTHLPQCAIPCATDHRGQKNISLNRSFECPHFVLGGGGQCHGGGPGNNRRVISDRDVQAANAMRGIGVRYLATLGGRYEWNLSTFYNAQNQYVKPVWAPNLR